ncbi:hypothetical protein L3X38_039820 [Prunus dulcis]|uniref:Uncharacterized protein n=1 Tax=Prunus dulcis TaxID=3755 RepID=A0AAD4V9B8_PRUDU|nr:hypothetical protein L3X38_039820 [Prunus dulcis]
MLRQLTKACDHGQLIICPIIHAQALEPTPQGARKVVLATSVAETSLLMLTGQSIEDNLVKLPDYGN